MDPVTHALASYSLTRAIFPRASASIQIAAIVAGTVADLDALSVFFGPVAYLEFRRTYFHSFATAILIAAACAGAGLLFARGKKPGAAPTTGLSLVFAASLAAAALHLALDACQSQGVELFWPLSSRRVFLDWLAPIDLSILALLLIGIFLPRLAALVYDEIGAKSKSPRGRTGAALTVAAILLFIGARAILHKNAVSALDAREYRGELPHRIAALPDARSPFRWTGIVETQSGLHEAALNLAVPGAFDPDTAFTSFKPELSPALEAAQNTPEARLFLSATRFPKATVEQTPAGFRVTLRSFPFGSAEPSLKGQFSSGRSVFDPSAPFGRPVEVVIEASGAAKVVSSDLIWQSSSPL